MRNSDLAWPLQAIVLCACAVGALGTMAAAAENDDFYRGKRLTLVIGTDTGGGYDLYGRTVGRHLVKHLPGNPGFLPQNMPGAGGRKAANYLFSQAAQDGTVIGTVNRTVALDQAFGEQGVQYDAAKFQWIGNPIVDYVATYTWADSGYRTLEDVKSKGGLICGGTAANNPTVTYPRIINELAGTDIRVIGGYPGAAELTLAMQRGETHCIAGDTWASIKSRINSLVEAGKISFIVQWGTEKNPEIAKAVGRDVPRIWDFVKSEQDRNALELIMSDAVMGRPLFAPPNVPAAQVAALRKAFDETMRDPEFLAEAAKLKMDIEPIAGERMQPMATAAASSSGAVLARAKSLMQPPRSYDQRKVEPAQK